MTESEFKLLKIGDRVRPIVATNGLRRVHQLTGRMGGDPNGAPFFKPVDLRKPGGVLGRIVRFWPEDIERYEMTMLDQHTAARTRGDQRPSAIAAPDGAAGARAEDAAAGERAAAPTAKRRRATTKQKQDTKPRA